MQYSSRKEKKVEKNLLSPLERNANKKKKERLVKTPGELVPEGICTNDCNHAGKTLKLFQQIIASSPDSISVLGRDYVYKYVNDACLVRSGLSREDIVGSTVADHIDAEVFQEVIKPGLERCLSGETVTYHEWFNYPAQGRRFMHVTYSPFRDEKGNIIGILVNSRDMTEARLAEEKLQASQERYRLLVDNTNEAIVVAQDGMHKFVNPSAVQLFGYSEAELLANPILKFIYPEDRAAISSHCQKRDRGEAVDKRFCYRLVCGDGGIKWVESSAVLIEWEGKPASLVLISDVTLRKKMEEEMIYTDKLESIGILASGIAHDFNNFLATMLGNISLAKLYESNTDKLLSKLNNIEKAVLRAKELTQQLFVFARGDTLTKKTVNIIDLIKDVTNFALSGCNVTAKFSFPEQTLLAEIDEGQINQVLNNIIINARQAMEKGGILEVKAGEVIIESTPNKSVTSLERGKYIKISVRDHGTGIPKKHLQKIFDPFFTTKREGNGLGLTTSYSIIKKHRGNIHVKSRPGEGTTVVIYLPAAQKAEDVSKENDPLPQGKGRILVMDDEASIRETAGEMLTYLGYEPVLAKNGKEAISLFEKATENRQNFDAVILDMTIPGGMGGQDTLKELQEIDPHVKAIVSSGYSGEQLMSRFREFGFEGIIAKPYNINDLAREIQKVLGQLPG